MRTPGRYPLRFEIAARAAAALGLCLATTALLAQPAQANGQVRVSGHVAPRCWANPPSPTAGQASPVRCTGNGPKILLAYERRTVSRTIDRDGSIPLDAVTVTVSPEA